MESITLTTPPISPRVRSRRIGSIDIEKGPYGKYQLPSPLRINYDVEFSSSKVGRPRARKYSWETRGNPVQRMRVKWNALSNRWKIWGICITSVILLLSTITLVDGLFWSYRTQPFLNHDRSFAVVMNTYKRPEQLAEAVQHYAEFCGRQYGVAHVYIVWAEEDVTPPDPDSFYLGDPAISTQNRAPVSFRRVKNSLNSRFLEIPDVDGPVFMVDDDIRVDCRSLGESFRAWKSNPDSMVGYYPRLAKKHENGYVYQSWPTVFFRRQINMVLSKACFLHSRFMKIYSSDEHPQAIRDYVDKYFNCEDVAMSLLVANVTKSERQRPAKPIYVEAKVSDMGLFNGISTGTGHMSHRSECLKVLTEIYQENGWGAPLDDSFQLEESTWVQHVPGFWWQTGSSNVFEWAAIGNAFK